MRLIAALVAMVAMIGCGESNESVAKRAGGKVGETLTDFARGVGTGVDKQLTVNVALSEEVTKLGLSKTVAKSRTLDPNMKNKQGISVYFVAKTPFKGALLTKAMNKEGEEIGRSVAEVEFAADDAKYVPFLFDQEMDTQLVDKYVVDVKK